jgi:hypothetical protein
VAWPGGKPQRVRRLHPAERRADRPGHGGAPLPLPAEVKAVLLATAGLAGSFGIAWLLIGRVPGVARIL